MTTWTPPADPRLSSNGIEHVVAGLTDPGARDTASAYLDEITDPGLLYVIARRIGEAGNDRPALGASEEGLRNFIRNRV